MHIENISFIGSFSNPEQCPDSKLPEYAFTGRSNVGKSSLINMLAGKKEIARISKKPGKTRLINMFLVDQAWRLVDLPGYGYAKVSKSEKAGWPRMIEKYLRYRKQLVCTFVLIDIRLPLQKNDLDFLNTLGENGVPFVIVYTKADKLSKQKRTYHTVRIESALSGYWDPLPARFVSSAATGEGRDAILEFITEQNTKLGIV